MLVLSRKVGQSLLIGDIEVKVLEVKNGRARLGIVADKDVSIFRHEVWIRMQEKKDQYGE